MRMCERVCGLLDRVLAALVAVCCLLVAIRPTNANPLGLTVALKEDAQALLQQLGYPELGPRKCLVVTAVDPEGPCAGLISPGVGLRKVGGQLVLDPERFEAVAMKFQPGDEVLVEGLYVKFRPGTQGVWVPGKQSVKIPEPRQPDNQPLATSSSKDFPQEDLSEPAIAMRKSSSGEEPDQPDKAGALDSGRKVDENGDASPDEQQQRSESVRNALMRAAAAEPVRAELAKTPYVPIGISFPDVEGYGQNLPIFERFDYSKGPEGQSLLTVFYRNQFDDGASAPTTAEGYLTSGIDELPGLDKPLERQVYLNQALENGSFRLHGRWILWHTREGLPSVVEAFAGEGGQAEPSLDVYAGKVYPSRFGWMWGGRLHGAIKYWGDGKRKPFLVEACVHGSPHFLEEQVYTDGIRRVKSWRFGYEHGGFGSYWSNGNAKSQFRKNRGEYEGKAFDWHEDGGLKFSTTYVDGNSEGNVEEWYPNGKRKSFGVWSEGALVGEEKKWDRNGNRIIPKQPHEQFIPNGEGIAYSHLRNMEQSVSKSQYQSFFNDLYLGWYLQQKSQMNEFPPGSNGHEVAKGQLEGYRNVMGKHVALP